MRNLSFIATPDVVDAARQFRAAFMKKTAVWNVAIRECTTQEDALKWLDGSDHAFVAAPSFRGLLYETAYVKGASCQLTEGSDVRYRGGSNTITLAQTQRSCVDALEANYIPIFGSNVVILGARSNALDMAYECSRAGVDTVTLLDTNRERVCENLTAFVDEYGRKRNSILDTEQARTGHLSAKRAYEHTSFTYGSLKALRTIADADIIISFMSDDHLLPDEVASVLKPVQIVCDPWNRSKKLMASAELAGCDILPYETIMQTWGRECAELLIDFGQAGA